ncbi:MAG: HAMP domain-containing histidine kinase [Lachnospiraceae bacterium]|nr:HAMP domain-containing histidine kinase [Lachnospiraceae bacterium]
MKRIKISKKIFIMALCCELICTVIFACLYISSDKDENAQDINSETIVSLNEVSVLLDDYKEVSTSDKDKSISDNNLLIKDKINTIIINLQNNKTETSDYGRKYIITAYLISIAVIIILFLVIWFTILRPFDKLERFAGEIASGNLDGELKYERVNMFGEFTWAFDHMRSELKKSREREHEAVENNKTIIATLSHDIKTPVTSIRAYAEGLADNMDSSPERRNRYIDVIMRKCDEVTKVTDDMFIHSLHDLDRLVINKDEVKLDEVINETIESIRGGKDDIVVRGQIDRFTLAEADSLRIAQVIENIITNARKYAPDTKIEVWSEIKDSYCLHIKDNGTGIPPEDMPFVFDKFYRGKNKSDKSGAGLGLFIVKYIMEAMGGSVALNNSRNGLEVVLIFYN